MRFGLKHYFLNQILKQSSKNCPFSAQALFHLGQSSISDGNTKCVETVCLATFLIKRSILDEDLFANHKSSTLLHLLDSQGHFSFCSSQSRWDYRRWHLCLVVCSHCFASGRHHCLGVTYICKAIQNFKKKSRLEILIIVNILTKQASMQHLLAHCSLVAC